VRRHHTRAAARGFTLIEAMTVVALLAVVAAVAAPSFRSFIGTMNTKAVAFDLIADLAYARSEAIKQNTPVTVAPAGGGWADGWTVAAGATVLRQHDALAPTIAVGNAAAVTFRPNGRLGTDTNPALLKWSVSSSVSGVTPRCVVIGLTGAARSENKAC
jgi:type IV fimbrial biogenesis protein FimT